MQSVLYLRLEKSSSVTVEGSMPRLSRHLAARGYSPTGSDSISDEKRVRKEPLSSSLSLLHGGV